MLSSIFLKTLYGLRWQILGWSVGAIFIVFITTALFDSFTQSGFEEIVSSIPEALKGFIGSADNYKSVPGYLAQQVFGLKIVMFMVVMSVLVFLAISANEEDDGRLQTLLTLPVTRSAVYFQKLLAGIAGTGVIMLCILATIYAGLAVIQKEVDAVRIIESVSTLWLVCCTFGLVGYSTAMLTGKKGLTTSVAIGYALFCIVLSSLAPAVDALKDIDKLSLLHYYNNPQIMQNGLDIGHTLILIGIFVVLTLIGWIGFRKRSITT